MLISYLFPYGNDVHRMLQQNCKAVYLPYYWLIFCGPRQLSWYSDSLQYGKSVDRISVEAIFSSPVQNAPGSHRASYTRGTLSLPGESGRGVVLKTHTRLPPVLKKEYSYISTLPISLRGLF